MLLKQVRTVLFLLVVVASAGLIMRSWAWLGSPNISFTNLRHAHSHLAFLGWVFPAVMLLFNRFFAPELKQTVDNSLFWVIVIINVLMFGAFIKYGYTGPSIVLLSVHTALAFTYAWRFLTHISVQLNRGQWLLVVSAIAIMCFSFLGPLAIPVIQNTGGGSSQMKLAIHFYLHFQYNGFFVLAVLALWSRKMANAQITFPVIIFLLGVCGTYFLTVSWGIESPILKFIGSVSAMVQLLGLIWLSFKLYPSILLVSNRIMKLLLITVLGSLFIKCVLQVASNWLPELSLDGGLHFWVIAYLHLIFLGTITPYLLFEFVKEKILPESKVISIALTLYLIGVVLTETVLGPQGASVYFSSTFFEHLTNLMQLGSLSIWISVLLFSVAPFAYSKQKS